jgi:RNA polymerase sigma-70 factor (ECF subfamily)
VLSDALVAGADKARDELLALADREAIAADLVERGRRAWPKIRLDANEFLAHVGRCVDGADDVRSTLTELQAGDVWLALACARGNARAIAEIDRTFQTVVTEALGRMKGKVASDDVAQTLRERLLVARAGRAPRILDYSGRGPLAAWIRIAAIRTALSSMRRGDAAAVRAVTREVLARVPATHDDPELEHLKRRHAKDFKAAFESALAELSPEERNLLRLSLVDGLSIDELGAVFRVHRATAARRLEKARDAVHERTRAILASRLSLGRSELRSLMGFVRSRLDLSIQRVLSASDDVGSRAPAKTKTRKRASTRATR